MDALDILVKTRQILEGHWIQGRSYNGNSDMVKPEDFAECSFCLSGGLRYAATGSPREFHQQIPSAFLDAENAVQYAVREVSPFKGYISWNDQFGRTEAEVLALLDRAIQKTLDTTTTTE